MPRHRPQGAKGLQASAFQSRPRHRQRLPRRRQGAAGRSIAAQGSWPQSRPRHRRRDDPVPPRPPARILPPLAPPPAAPRAPEVAGVRLTPPRQGDLPPPRASPSAISPSSTSASPIGCCRKSPAARSPWCAAPDGSGRSEQASTRKHITQQFPATVQRVEVEEGGKKVLYGVIDSLAGLVVALVQMGALELQRRGLPRRSSSSAPTTPSSTSIPTPACPAGARRRGGARPARPPRRHRPAYLPQDHRRQGAPRRPCRFSAATPGTRSRTSPTPSPRPAATAQPDQATPAATPSRLPPPGAHLYRLLPAQRAAAPPPSPRLLLCRARPGRRRLDTPGLGRDRSGRRRARPTPSPSPHLRQPPRRSRRRPLGRPPRHPAVPHRRHQAPLGRRLLAATEDRRLAVTLARTFSATPRSGGRGDRGFGAPASARLHDVRLPPGADGALPWPARDEMPGSQGSQGSPGALGAMPARRRRRMTLHGGRRGARVRASCTRRAVAGNLDWGGYRTGPATGPRRRDFGGAARRAGGCWRCGVSPR